MKYPSSAEIAEMKANGYDTVTIRKAEERAARWPAAQELCETIKKAFAGVTLGNGVGLRQGLAMDDYADEAACLLAREGDEKEDWARIPVEDLNGYADSLSFFDGEGMRFHLPAFLIADILGTFQMDLVYRFTFNFFRDFKLPPGLPPAFHFQMPSFPPEVEKMIEEGNRNQMSLLSGDQRHAVRAYLLFLADDPEHEWNRQIILNALQEYWTVPG